MAGKRYGTAAYPNPDDGSLSHPPAKPGSIENRCWTDGVRGLIRPPASDPVGRAAYDAGAGAASTHEAGGTSVYAPINGGYNFDGASGSYAESSINVNADSPPYCSVQFKPTTTNTNSAIVQVSSTNMFRLRHNTSGQMQAQHGGSALTTYTTLTVTAGKEYLAIYTQVGADATITLHNITDKTSANETQTLAGGAAFQNDVMSIGSTEGGGAANFNGVIANVKFGSAGSQLDNWWKFDEGSGGTAADSVGSATLTISGTGAWV